MAPRVEPFPWRMAQIHLPPVGLRETVARVAFLAQHLVTDCAAVHRESLMKTCAIWRLTEPKRWAALCTAVGVPCRKRAQKDAA